MARAKRKKKSKWQQELDRRKEKKAANIAMHPIPQWSGKTGPNPKDYPLRLVTGPGSGGSLPGTTRWILECGHAVPRRDGQVDVADKTGCHFCAGAVGRNDNSEARKAKKMAELMTREQRKKLGELMDDIDTAFAVMADSVIRIKLRMWQAYAGSKRLTPSGDLLLAQHEVALLAGVHPETVRAWRTAGKIGKGQRIGQSRYYLLGDVLKLMRKFHHERGVLTPRKIRKGSRSNTKLFEELEGLKRQGDEQVDGLEEVQRELGANEDLL